MALRVLNLYAGIGGNRQLWDNVNVTAIEHNHEIAQIYRDQYPQDTVIEADAHQYLLEHINDDWDFIWAPPPCQSHSVLRYMAAKNHDYPPIYPDMSLYSEIIFLKHYSDARWIIENTNAYYETLIKPIYIGRHCFWANFIISKIAVESNGTYGIHSNHNVYGINLSKYKIKTARKDQILRNMVNPQLGRHILDCAFKIKQKTILEAME